MGDDKEKTEKRELTLSDLKELISSMVESNVMSKGFVKLGDLKDQIHGELDPIVEKKLKPMFEAEIAKLAKLPGQRGVADVNKADDSQLKGLNKSGGYDLMADFARDVYLDGQKHGRPSATYKKWMGDVDAYDEVVKTVGSPTMEVGDPEQGGSLVPPEFSTTLMERGMANSDFITLATKVPMARNSVTLPFCDDFTHTTYVHGAMAAYWGKELGEKTATKPKFGKVTLELNKLYVMVYASDELLEDSAVSIEPFLMTKAPQAIGWKLDAALFNGTGAGLPLGAINAGNPALITVTKEGGQAADTIVAQNVINMYARMPAMQRAGAVWVANEDIFPQLCQMYIAAGAGGVPVYLPANGLANQPFDTLMGKRILWSEHASALGDLGDIAFIAWSEYLVGQKRGAGSGITYATSIHLKFDFDQTAFRWVFRIDGQPWWSKVFTPNKGATKSPFIVLEAR